MTTETIIIIIISLQLLFTILNILCALYQVKLGNYTIAILNGGAAGYCFTGFLHAIVLCGF